MINDGNAFKIVHNSWGSYYAHDCTVENALELMQVHLHNVGEHISMPANAIRDKTHYIVNTAVVIGALNEFFTAKVGDDLPKVTRLLHGKPNAEKPTPMVTFKAEHLTDVMTWTQSNGVALMNLKDLTSRAQYELGSMNPKSLFLLNGVYKRAGSLEVMFLESQCLELAEELVVLQRNTWKETAKESNVVQRYLTFITEHLTHRDEKYHLADYENAKF